jgi:uncharacterized protein YecE (DUF72 family)
MAPLPCKASLRGRSGGTPCRSYQHRFDEELHFCNNHDYTFVAMAVVACSGFPVPVSRYFREFQGVEISETELGIPGAGTVRRWLREAPEGFVFTLLAPKDIATSGFQLNPVNDKLIKEVGALCKSMNAYAVVFAAPPELTPTRPNKAAIKKFVEALPARYPKAVISLGGWKLSDVVSVIDGKKNVVPAFDPLQDELNGDKAELLYLRLPGPAGHRSRYDESSLERVVAQVKASKAKNTVCVFHNVDMHANATRARELLGQK